MNPELTRPEAGTGARLLHERLRQRTGRPAARPVIPPAPRGGALPLSSAQQRLWVLDRIRPGGAEYVVPLVLRLDGDLSPLDLGGALTELVCRHEILRTRYATDDAGEPIQVIDPPAAVELAVDDLTADPAALRALLETEATRPFDLAAGPVLRARLIRLAPREHVLALVMHHIAVDGWSGGLLLQELAALCTGRSRPRPVLQYADYAVWQRGQLAGDRLTRGLEHWTTSLRGLPALELPTDRPRPAQWQSPGGTVPFEITAELGRRVTALARAHRATPFMVHLAAFWSLLSRYTGQADFAVGSPIAGRTHAGTHDMVGLFVNLLPLRADLTGDPSFADLLDRARRTALDAYAQQDVPFERIVDVLVAARDLSVHPLVNVVLTMQNYEPFRFAAGEVRGEVLPVLAQRAKFDLSWTIEERPDGSVGGEATFAHALFDSVTVRRLAGHYVRLLDAATARPWLRVSELPLLAAAEVEFLVRGPVAQVAAGACLHERFADRAGRDPDAIAVSHAGRQVSYGELDGHANRLAHRLRALGVGREDRVGVCLPRCVDLVVASLAALKAGAGYLPLDPDHPAERIEFLIRDAGARVVVTDTVHAPRVAATGVADERIVVDDPGELAALAAMPAHAPAAAAHPDDLAYVIYTSGSTGRPKGVQVSHANVTRLFAATESEFGFGPHDVWALFHSYSFDFSVWEMWGPLLYGGRLVVVPYQVSRSPWELVEVLADEGVTVLNQTPSAFRSLVELAGRDEAAVDRLRIRLVVFGGEALDVGMLEPWWGRFGDRVPRLVNMYGITETTIHVTYRPVDRADLARAASPIGQPIKDVCVYLLDEWMRPVPLGSPGEIYVGGGGVARGYLGLPSLTAQRFVPDPFAPAGGRLYRTGDRARRLAGGDLEFLGRLDDQVKIRGYRIELGEVEACLSGHPDLEAAVVAVHEPAPGHARLVAYLVPREGTAVSVPDVRGYATARLPGYMVPAVFLVLAELPLTANGKVDRRALPEPDSSRPEQRHSYLAPRTDAERTMAGIWADVLGTARVGVHDNFFALGGDSIRAVRLVGALRASGFDRSVQDLFQRQSIAALLAGTERDATHAEQVGTRPFALLDPADRVLVPDGVVDAYPMSRVQAGMVYELLADPDRNLYHNVTSYLIRDPGPFDPAALVTATEALVADHEILRTSFDLVTFTEPTQLVHSRATVEVSDEDLRALTTEEQQARMAAFRERERVRVFDLGTAPLLRVNAHRIADDRWYLSLTECHAILDGWSHNSITTELLAGYRAVRDGGAPPRRAATAVRYADYIAQEQRSLADPGDREFWAGKLRGASRLAIPSAWAEPEAPLTSNVVPVSLREIEHRLRELAARAQTSVKSVLLAAHVAVWRTIAGSESFYCGLVSNGRTEVAGGDQVRGMFLNPVPLRAPTGWSTWLELIAAVFAEEVELWPHRRYPLPELQREFGQGGRLLDVAFNYLDFHVLDRQMVDTSGSIDVSPNEFPLSVVKQGPDLYVAAKARYAGRRHLRLLAQMYHRALTAMVDNPDGDARVSLLPPAERVRLLAAGTGERRSRPRDPVHLQVAARAATSPDVIAVEGCAGDRLTYRQLVDRADAWAARLAGAGVEAGALVGLCLPRMPDLVAAALGVLTVGAVYVPLDPGHPGGRIATLLRDAGAATLVTVDEVADRLPADAVTVITPGDLDVGPRRVAAHRPDPEDLVCVIHTSGSTGRPKGVMVRHGALADRVMSMRRNVGLTDRDVVVAVVPMVTDVCQLAHFVALVHGARLVVADDDFARDPLSLAQLLRDSGATFMQASPTTWRMLLESGWAPPAGFRALSGGEAMTTDLLRRLCDSDAEVWDMYGPTEATVFCFGTRHPTGAAECGAPRRITAANTATYLLGPEFEPVPEGVTGEIFVGGDCLARGYLGKPRATADAFLPDPHAGRPGGRMYATGDLGRYVHNGLVEVLGRRDHQVKIRGFRVELGEVENALTDLAGVRAAAVRAVRADDPHAEARLAAYVILDDSARSNVDGLRDQLSERLPEHMVPTHVVALPAFPRLPNGKVDRAALPAPDARRPEVTRYVPPLGPTERAIAEVWGQALGIERVGRDDDFFALGGHSLLTLRILARLRREHGIGLTFRDLLTHRTPRRIAAAHVAPASRDRTAALLWLGDRGAATPLFCVHPGGGSAHWYHPLAEVFAPHRPVAAFEWPGLHDEHSEPGSLAEIAAGYVDELRADRPTGPYHIFGFCGSGGIAWEMARQLHTAGGEVRLILLDPFEYATARANPLEANLVVIRRAERLLASVEPDARTKLTRILRDLVDDGDVLLDQDDPALDDTWRYRLRTWRQMLQARSRFRFPTYSGTLDMIACDALVAGRYSGLIGLSFTDYVDKWRALASGGVRVHRVPGDHGTALRPPHVSALAAVLTAILEEAR